MGHCATNEATSQHLYMPSFTHSVGTQHSVSRKCEIQSAVSFVRLSVCPRGCVQCSVTSYISARVRTAHLGYGGGASPHARPVPPLRAHARAYGTPLANVDIDAAPARPRGREQSRRSSTAYLSSINRRQMQHRSANRSSAVKYD